MTILVSEVLKGDSPSPTGPASEIVSCLLITERRSLLELTSDAGAVPARALFRRSCRCAHARERDRGRLARIGLVPTLVAYTAYVLLTAALACGAAVDAGLRRRSRFGRSGSLRKRS